MEKFKFFSDNKIVPSDSMWEELGALDGATNRYQLNRVLNITSDYMIDNEIDCVYLIPIMIRLFGDKNHEYGVNLITTYISDIIDDVEDLKNGFNSNDWETEMCAVIADRYYWYEREDGEIERNANNF